MSVEEAMDLDSDSDSDLEPDEDMVSGDHSTNGHAPDPLAVVAEPLAMSHPPEPSLLLPSVSSPRNPWADNDGMDCDMYRSQLPIDP